MKKRLLLILAIGIAFAPMALADTGIGPYNSPDRADQSQMGSVFCDANITRLADKSQSPAPVNTRSASQAGQTEAGTVD